LFFAGDGPFSRGDQRLVQRVKLIGKRLEVFCHGVAAFKFLRSIGCLV
jgi:hypothetical protein